MVNDDFQEALRIPENTPHLCLHFQDVNMNQKITQICDKNKQRHKI